jgi:hypothetical protein
VCIVLVSAGVGSAVHDCLLWPETAPLRTVYETDLGVPLADVNLLLVSTALMYTLGVNAPLVGKQPSCCCSNKPNVDPRLIPDTGAQVTHDVQDPGLCASSCMQPMSSSIPLRVGSCIEDDDEAWLRGHLVWQPPAAADVDLNATSRGEHHACAPAWAIASGGCQQLKRRRHQVEADSAALEPACEHASSGLCDLRDVSSLLLCCNKAHC